MLYCYAAVTGKVSTNAQKCTIHPLKACDQYILKNINMRNYLQYQGDIRELTQN